MGFPIERYLKATVHKNMMQNKPITLGTIKSAHEMFGPDVPSLKGKTVMQKPSHVVIKYVSIQIQIYGRNRTIMSVADLFFVNRLSFLLTISRNSKLLTVEYAERRISKCLEEATENAVRNYTSLGFVVTMDILDRQCDPLIVKTREVDMNINGAAELAPEFERVIRRLK